MVVGPVSAEYIQPEVAECVEEGHWAAEAAQQAAAAQIQQAQGSLSGYVESPTQRRERIRNTALEAALRIAGIGAQADEVLHNARLFGAFLDGSQESP